jgi:SNF2 family DNA or RNA helicase
MTGQIEFAKNISFGLLICDEAHRLKNQDTKVYKQLYGLRSRMRIMISGTPVQNDLLEFYALLEFCMPGCFGTKKDFARKIGTPVAKMRQLDATTKEVEDGTKASNLFTNLTKTVLLRRTNEVNAR